MQRVCQLHRLHKNTKQRCSNCRLNASEQLPPPDLWVGAKGAEGSAYRASGASSHRCSCLACDGSLDAGGIAEPCAARRLQCRYLAKKNMVAACVQLLWWWVVVMKMQQDDCTIMKVVVCFQLHVFGCMSVMMCAPMHTIISVCFVGGRSMRCYLMRKSCVMQVLS